MDAIINLPGSRSGVAGVRNICRIAAFMLLIALSAARPTPARPQSMSVAQYERQSQVMARQQQKASRKAAKKQGKILRKSGKKQRKAMKQYQKTQRKPGRRSNRRR
jgi:hypothetical protein